MSMDQMIAEIISIASSAASMDRRELKNSVIQLETHLLRARTPASTAALATNAQIRN
jgi:hypothetical protein